MEFATPPLDAGVFRSPSGGDYYESGRGPPRGRAETVCIFCNKVLHPVEAAKWVSSKIPQTTVCRLIPIVRTMRADGKRVAEIMREIKMPRATVATCIRRNNLGMPPFGGGEARERLSSAMLRGFPRSRSKNTNATRSFAPRPRPPPIPWHRGHRSASCSSWRAPAESDSFPETSASAWPRLRR